MDKTNDTPNYRKNKHLSVYERGRIAYSLKRGTVPQQERIRSSLYVTLKTDKRRL